MKRTSAVAAAVALALIAAPAEAAVTVYQDGHGLVYRATRGEANHFVITPFQGEVVGFATSTMRLQDDTAPLKQRGSFCLAEVPLRCPAVATYAYMRDGDDYARVSPYEREAHVWGQDGNDDLGVSGRDHVSAHGGRGDDHIVAGVDGDAALWGEAGNDTLSVGTAASFRVYGGGGDDVLYGSQPYVASVIDGGPGNDRIGAGTGCSCITVLGQAGRDTIHVEWAGTVDGGSNDDTIVGHGPDIRGNWGKDTIDVSGSTELSSPDTVSCGPGADTVIADADDIVAADCETVTRL